MFALCQHYGRATGNTTPAGFQGRNHRVRRQRCRLYDPQRIAFGRSARSREATRHPARSHAEYAESQCASAVLRRLAKGKADRRGVRLNGTQVVLASPAAPTYFSSDLRGRAAESWVAACLRERYTVKTRWLVSTFNRKKSTFIRSRSPAVIR
jgi:hypothetical protein